MQIEGFSLIEMLAVMFIIALAGAAAIPLAGNFVERGTPKVVLQKVQSLTLETRSTAISTGRPQSIAINVPGRAISDIDRRQEIELPEAFRIHLTVGIEEVREDGSALVWFYPDGGTTGATLILDDEGGNAARLSISWLNGGATLSQLDDLR